MQPPDTDPRDREQDAPPAGRYANPPIPEGINVTDEHPLREFVWLGGGMLAAVVVLVIVFAWLGHIVGSLVPFETERRLAGSIGQYLGPASDEPDRAQLQALADRLTAADPLPEGMSISVHLLDDDEINAFATLGGHIVVARGLVEAMPSENALALVLAHEIAHVRERHVIRTLSRGVLTSLAMAVLFGAAEGDLPESFAGQAGITAGLTFSRAQEREADALALRGVHALYGHVAGASALFDLLTDSGRYTPPEWLSTHPQDGKRSDALEALARGNGWPLAGELTPLPARPQ
ncbi:MAG: M48 family metallopeptidase [Rhodocyclales bacterium]|nr:M48 family metallopeptidase [Rhodocyclales bacterium]